MILERNSQCATKLRSLDLLFQTEKRTEQIVEHFSPIISLRFLGTSVATKRQGGECATVVQRQTPGKLHRTTADWHGQIQRVKTIIAKATSQFSHLKLWKNLFLNSNQQVVPFVLWSKKTHKCWKSAFRIEMVFKWWCPQTTYSDNCCHGPSDASTLCRKYSDDFLGMIHPKCE